MSLYPTYLYLALRVFALPLFALVLFTLPPLPYTPLLYLPLPNAPLPYPPLPYPRLAAHLRFVFRHHRSTYLTSKYLFQISTNMVAFPLLFEWFLNKYLFAIRYLYSKK